MGPQQPESVKVMREKHRLKNEGFVEGVNRITGHLSDSTEHYRKIREIALENRFIFAGRIQASAGSAKSTTLYNCFVSPTIEDSFVDGENCIMDCLTQAVKTMRLGGGIGYDFSTLRPRGARIKKLDSGSSGPVALMEMFDAGGRAIASSGHRRGAQMGVMRIDHPDIEEFIHAKQTPGVLTGFNVSVGVTDDFMLALLNDEPFSLKWGGEEHSQVDARALWDQIMRGTWDHAEPGVLFIDTINRMNNLWYCEHIAATNPCGEQPLPPYGACLLGSFNMTRYLSGGNLSLDQLRADIPHVVRAMDNVVDRSVYPLKQQKAEAKNKRRMGLGVTGMANAIESLGHPYGSTEYMVIHQKILKTIAVESYRASCELAAEKGAFPMFDAEKFLQSGFMESMTDEIRDMVGAMGIRNSHLTSIAPTGSISFGICDNVSSSIEPVFSYEQRRTVRGEHETKDVIIQDYGVKYLDTRGKRTVDVTVAEHLDVLEGAQRWTDSAVSKTVNCDGSVSWEDFSKIYTDAWDRGCKGITTYRTDGMREGVLASADTCEIMPDGTKSCE